MIHWGTTGAIAPGAAASGTLGGHSRTSSAKSIRSPDLSFLSSHSFHANDSPQRSILSVSTSQSGQTDLPEGRTGKTRQLEAALVKFSTTKKVNTPKTNILRLSLLKYLRNSSNTPPIGDLLSTSVLDMNLDAIGTEAACLLNWWTLLLGVVVNDFSSVPAIDKPCYLECLSRLASANIWLLVTHHRDRFGDLASRFESIVLRTFEAMLTKLSLKTGNFDVISGKIFALAFFNIPCVSHGLAFLLNTKLKSYKRIHNICFNNSLSYSVMPVDFSQTLNDICLQYPPHLAPLISSAIRPREVKFTIEAKFMNAVKPPPGKITGIKDPKGPWAIKWSSLESVNLFCLFLRNYININSIHLRNFPAIMISEHHVYLSPGFICILTHIYEILELEIRRKLAVANKPSMQQQVNSSFNQNVLLLPPVMSTEFPSDRIVSVIKDSMVNPRSFEYLLSIGLVKGYENVLKTFMASTRLLDYNRAQIILGLFLSFLRSLNIDMGGTSPLSHLDWKFWLDAIVQLLGSMNLQNELRALVTLYEIWDIIPNNVYDIGNSTLKITPAWLTKPKSDIKTNLFDFLLSPTQWDKFFAHYNSLSRELYLKLLVWKILGVRSLGVVKAGDTVDHNLDEKYKLVEERLNSAYELTKQVCFVPVDPIVNKKFQIGECVRPPKLKATVYPYEVIDEAYLTAPTSCASSSLDLSPRGAQSKSSIRLHDLFSKSSTSSSQSHSSGILGKLFKSDSSKKLMKRSPSQQSMSSLDSDIETEPDFEDFKPPPELSFKSLDPVLPKYEFTLVPNEVRIQQFLNLLNDHNASKFGLSSETLLQNYQKPRLPCLGPVEFRNIKSKFGDSLDSIVEFRDDDFLGDVEIDNESIDLLTPTTERTFLQAPALGTPPTAFQTNMANGLYGYMANVAELELQMEKILTQIDTSDVLDGDCLEVPHVPRNVNYQLRPSAMQRVQSHIPSIPSDIHGDKPNAY